MNFIVPFLACVCIAASPVSAQPNKAPQKKQTESQPKEPITVVVEEQKISTAGAEEKADDHSPHWCAALKRPEWWLFIAAVFSFGAIADQARESARATKAMRDGIKLQSESLRPRLMIDAGISPFMDMIGGNKITVDIAFINTGGIPAYGVSPETWLEFLDIPFPAFTSNAVHQTGGKITVHPHQPSPFRIPFGRALTPEEIGKLKAVEATLYLRVRLVYEVFGKPKYTDYIFQVTPTTLNIENCEAD